ncbi:MAG: hypothetical protein KC931_10950 [Candidatus Omnitrophica bacterium]|nr:hypothetical protein [Candidatus Omnitrophota bacterium]MCA9414951.1 hypothetical protein [Candidatus Omnitrophota bacterium]MCA9429985.1 hypothetical protein [Candidatus Omnitrophota bacterium]MCA9441727.1 hypothetical protein [Candidatus Omnitrophota bacterium]MCA9447627.1 hypothetical protein [Candidatus Omnitrophota bacterium]
MKTRSVLPNGWVWFENPGKVFIPYKARQIHHSPQSEGETLFVSSKKNWFLKRDRNGQGPSWEKVDRNDAFLWLVRNQYDFDRRSDEAVQELLEEFEV